MVVRDAPYPHQDHSARFVFAKCTDTLQDMRALSCFGLAARIVSGLKPPLHVVTVKPEFSRAF